MVSAMTRTERVAGLIRDFWPHRMSLQAAASIEKLYAEETIDESHLAGQRRWSEATFGPGPRTLGITAHIRKELQEIEDDPTDLTEWIDVAILALDGAWRTGGLRRYPLHRGPALLLQPRGHREPPTQGDPMICRPTCACQCENSACGCRSPGKQPPARPKAVDPARFRSETPTQPPSKPTREVTP